MLKGSAATVSADAIARCAAAPEMAPGETRMRICHGQLLTSFTQTVDEWRQRGWIASSSGAECLSVGS